MRSEGTGPHPRPGETGGGTQWKRAGPRGTEVGITRVVVGETLPKRRINVADVDLAFRQRLACHDNVNDTGNCNEFDYIRFQSVLLVD